MKKKYIDLHIHTNKSDGFYSPSGVIKLAKNNDTSLISICDHDSIDSLSEIKSELLSTMKAVNGVEFSTYLYLGDKRIKLHLLGYGFDENSQNLLFMLNELKQKRINAHLKVLEITEQMLKKLPEKSLINIDMERYCWFDQDVVKCMEIDNFSEDEIKRVEGYFKQNRFTYGSDYEINIRQAIDGIKLCGGFAVLAHPMAYDLSNEEVAMIIQKLTDFGLDGIEAYQSDCKIVDTMFLKDLACKYNLLWSVGSDFHRIIDSDGRMIGRGINNNLCVTETTLSRKILEKKLYFIGKK